MRGAAEFDAIKRWLAQASDAAIGELVERVRALRPGVQRLKLERGDGSRTSYSRYWCAVSMADAIAALRHRDVDQQREALARFFCAWNLCDHVWKRGREAA